MAPGTPGHVALLLVYLNSTKEESNDYKLDLKTEQPRGLELGDSPLSVGCCFHLKILGGVIYELHISVWSFSCFAACE